MNLTGGFVLLSVIWFLTFYIVLQLRTRTQGDEGSVVPGTPEGAPAREDVGKSAKIATVWALLIFGAVAAVILSPGSEERIPELRRRLGARPLLLGITSDSVESRSHCLEWGADDFWLPSLGTSDLLTRLRLHLGAARGKAHAAVPVSALLQVEDLRVDPVARQAWRGLRPLTLTSREYQLLLLLLRHRGAVLSRERILEEIWPGQGGGASNVIEVYVRYLRQKLEQEGERRLIHTLRGRGYCLSDGRPPSGPRP
jgi:DNA-binding response OmpR family regulator/predicted secreted protein